MSVLSSSGPLILLHNYYKNILTNVFDVIYFESQSI